MRKKTPQWKNHLSPEMIAEGMNLAANNSKRLLDDATFLYEAERYPSSLSLSILSIEEAGKLSILRGLSTAKSGDQVALIWKRYRRHTEKNRMSLLPDLFKEGARALDDFKSIFTDGDTNAQLVDDLKQLAIYTDCIGNKKWSHPSDVVTKDLAKAFLFSAETLQSEHIVTKREIELWIKHMLPVLDTSLQDMKLALDAWYADMHKEGLIEKIPTNLSTFLK